MRLKLLAAVIAGVILAFAIPSESVAPPVVWRDDYVHEPGWVALPVKRPLVGRATWYDATRNNAWYTQPNKWGNAIEFYAAAGPALRKIIGHKYMRKPYLIWVKSRKTGIKVKVWVVDWCGCLGRKNDPLDTRLIDLAPAVWERLGVPLGQGVMKVEIRIPRFDSPSPLP